MCSVFAWHLAMSRAPPHVKLSLPIFYKTILRDVSCESSTNLGSILIFASCVVSTCKIIYHVVLGEFFHLILVYFFAEYYHPPSLFCFPLLTTWFMFFIFPLFFAPTRGAVGSYTYRAYILSMLSHINSCQTSRVRGHTYYYMYYLVCVDINCVRAVCSLFIFSPFLCLRCNIRLFRRPRLVCPIVRISRAARHARGGSLSR